MDLVFFKMFQHVVPVVDVRQHDATTIFRGRRGQKNLPYCPCECKPNHLELKNGGMIIIHTPFDGRDFTEAVEQAREIIKRS